MKRRSFLMFLGMAPAVPVLLKTKDVNGTLMPVEEKRHGQRRNRHQDLAERIWDTASRGYLDMMVSSHEEAISSSLDVGTRAYISVSTTVGSIDKSV